MKQLIIKIILTIISIIPVRKFIIFESIPDMSDNTKAVFDEFLKRGFNKKYKLIWLTTEADKNAPKIKNVYYIKYHSFQKQLCVRMAKCLICCNRWLETHRKGQTAFYLSHGTPIKKLKGYYSVPQKIDYCLSPSKHVNFLFKSEMMATDDKLFPLGFPRNDVLTGCDKDLKPLFKDTDFDKIIVWYPTYRQHKNANIKLDVNSSPIIHNIDIAEELNKFANKLNVLIVLKPHFVQDVSLIKKMNFSNIKLIDDNFFSENNITSYEFVGKCDALITDYSSIYFDYTICNKPIALIWEDYDTYKIFPGFADGVDALLSGGEKIYNFEQLKTFIKNVSLDIDTLQDERNRICSLVNYSTDGKNAERVTDFIIEKADL